MGADRASGLDLQLVRLFSSCPHNTPMLCWECITSKTALCDTRLPNTCPKTES